MIAREGQTREAGKKIDDESRPRVRAEDNGKQRDGRAACWHNNQRAIISKLSKGSATLGPGGQPLFCFALSNRRHNPDLQLGRHRRMQLHVHGV